MTKIVRVIVNRDPGAAPAGVPSARLPMSREMVLDMVRAQATGDRPVRSAILQTDTGGLLGYEIRDGKVYGRDVVLKRRRKPGAPVKPTMAERLREQEQAALWLSTQARDLSVKVTSLEAQNGALLAERAEMSQALFATTKRAQDAERERNELGAKVRHPERRAQDTESADLRTTLRTVLAEIGERAADKARADAAEQALREAERDFAEQSARDRDEIIRLRAMVRRVTPIRGMQEAACPCPGCFGCCCAFVPVVPGMPPHECLNDRPCLCPRDRGDGEVLQWAPPIEAKTATPADDSPKPLLSWTEVSDASEAEADDGRKFFADAGSWSVTLADGETLIVAGVAESMAQAQIRAEVAAGLHDKAGRRYGGHRPDARRADPHHPPRRDRRSKRWVDRPSARHHSRGRCRYAARPLRARQGHVGRPGAVGSR